MDFMKHDDILGINEPAESRINRYDSFFEYLSDKDKNNYEIELIKIETERNSIHKKYNEIAAETLSRRERSELLKRIVEGLHDRKTLVKDLSIIYRYGFTLDEVITQIENSL